jgi:hypothetical protein
MLGVGLGLMESVFVSVALQKCQFISIGVRSEWSVDQTINFEVGIF